MVVGEASIHNIMGGMESTGGVRLHNHKRKLKQRFDIIKKLGQGTYGKVQLGINKETGQEVAIKTIKKCKIETEADLIRIRREIQIMSSVQHPNIIHIYEVFENREKMVLVMEYAAGGELYDYLSERKVLSEEEARRIFRQISIAVFYCHKHKICHRDLKLENILLDTLGNAKIADFGLSNVFDEQRLLNTFCGSPLYASPEIVKGTPYHGPEVDCWSLGVLLYTLVYGAMPFDGSNFKRLTRQISASDYFEPKNPSPASPLIKEMLTKCPTRRADIERICSHWWVNEGYEQNCLHIAEDLAAQTPVRLDLLLSLVPQSASADKLVVTNDQQQGETVANMSTDPIVPTRCHSVGSLMELDRNNCDKIRDMVEGEEPTRATGNETKRKLETTPSMEETVAAGVKRKERSRRKERSDEREPRSYRSTSRHHSAPISNAITEEAMEIDPVELDLRDPAAAAACLELIKEAQSKSPSKERSRTPVAPDPTTLETKDIGSVNENIEEIKPIANKMENVEKNEKTEELKSEEKISKSKPTDGMDNNDVHKSQVPTNDTIVSQTNDLPAKPIELDKNDVVKTEIKKIKQKALSLDSDEAPAVAPAKPTERRRSKIFEQAEKFNQLASGMETEKPKKIFIPGVNVGGAKRAFERKLSLSSVTVPQPVKQSGSKVIIDVSSEKKTDKVDEKPVTSPKIDGTKHEDDIKREYEKKRAVDIITGALGKPPVQKKLNGSPPLTPMSAESKKLGLKIQIAPNDVRNATVSVTTPVDTKYPDFDAAPAKPIAIGSSVPTTPESKKENSFAGEPTMSSKMEITLKSATLPRPRKTSKAEITLAGVKPPESVAFKSQVEAKIDAFQPQKLRTQKSEVAFPVAAAATAVITPTNRSSSLEPDTKLRNSTAKERIIPIHVEPGHQSPQQSNTPPPTKPPMPQRSMSQRSNSLSRQSTMDSDTDSALGSTVGPEPIKKSAREYIIPIAVEGGGYVTPRSGSAEPESKTSTPTSATAPRSRFGRPRRMGSLLSDASEDESPFSTLHRDSDDLLHRHMHRLRSSRPTRQPPEHADSLSSGEDDDDDGFELLTAENLFSTLLSRVRSLTQRLNVDDNRGTGFPRSRLLERLGTNSSQGFWGVHEPLSRRLQDYSESPFRRSLSRDTDRFGRKDSAMSTNPGTPTNSLGPRSTSSRESVFEMGSSNTLPRDKTRDNEPDTVRRRKEPKDSTEQKVNENFTPSLARRLSRQFIEQTRQTLPRSPSIPRDRLHRSATEEPRDSLTILPEYRSRSSDRGLRRTSSLLEAERLDRQDHRPTRRSVSLFDDNDDELLPPLPRQIMTLGRKYRDPVKTAVNGIRRDNICRTEKIQEESTDDVNSPRKMQEPNDINLEQTLTSEGTSVSNSTTNLGDLTPSLSTKSCETSPTESSSNIQGEALNSFKADAKEFESRLLAAENLIKESKLRNLGLNRFDPNLNSNYKDTDKCDKELLGSMSDLTSTVLTKRRSCIPSLRLRSGSLTREASLCGGDRKKSEDTKQHASTPERSLLSKFFRAGSSSRDSESKDKSPSARRRISRFLRPDFFDTPREESQYVKEKEAQKAAENERRKSRFMKRKNDNKEADVDTTKEEKQEKELKNEANVLTREKSESLPRDNKSENGIVPVIANADTKLERQNSKNSFLQCLEKKLEKLRANDDSAKITNGDVMENSNLPMENVIKPTETHSESNESLKKAASVDDLSLIDTPPVASKSKVSSVLGLFKNDSKSAINGNRQPGTTILSKFKRNTYKGSRSDTSVINGETSVNSKIPMKSKVETKIESKSPRRSSECKKSPEKIFDAKKPPIKEKSKTPPERASLERKISVDRQIKSPKKLSPEKSIEVKPEKADKSTIKDRSVEKELRKSVSPEKPDKTTTSRLGLLKKSPDKVLDNKKIEVKINENDEKKVVKVKKSLTSLAKNGSVTKLKEGEEQPTEKKVKKVIKKETVEKDGADGTKKKKIIRVVKKVVKKSDSSSDSKSEEKEKTKKTLLKKITSKKESSPENLLKKKEKSPEIKVTSPPPTPPTTTTITKEDRLVNKIDPSPVPDSKAPSKESENKLRANRSNLKLDLSKIPQHTFKSATVVSKRESPKPEISKSPADTPVVSENHLECQLKHSQCDRNIDVEIITDKPSKSTDELQEIPNENKSKDISNVKTEESSQPVHIKVIEAENESKNKLTDTFVQHSISKIPPRKITPDHTEDILSPMEDGESFDSWSICSNDMNHRGSMDLQSPTSPSYSPSIRNDHSESIIDRIRRKSFYSRFNERKRKSSLNVPPPGVTLPTSSTLPRKFSFHSSRDTERRRRNYSTSPTRRSIDRTYSMYNDDLGNFRKSPSERDRYSDIGSSHSSYSSDLKSPGEHYGSTSSYYDPLRRYRTSPTPDLSLHRKYQSTEYGLDSDVGPYKSPLSPPLTDIIPEYRSRPRKYGSAVGGEPKTAEYYEELLSPSRTDYLTVRRTPIPGEYPAKHENGYYNGNLELSKSGSDKWRGYFDKTLDSAEDSDSRSRGEDIRSSSRLSENKELSAACPDTEATTSIIE